MESGNKPVKLGKSKSWQKKNSTQINKECIFLYIQRENTILFTIHEYVLGCYLISIFALQCETTVGIFVWLLVVLLYLLCPPFCGCGRMLQPDEVWQCEAYAGWWCHFEFTVHLQQCWFDWSWIMPLFDSYQNSRWYRWLLTLRSCPSPPATMWHGLTSPCGMEWHHQSPAKWWYSPKVASSANLSCLLAVLKCWFCLLMHTSCTCNSLMPFAQATDYCFKGGASDHCCRSMWMWCVGKTIICTIPPPLVVSLRECLRYIFCWLVLFQKGLAALGGGGLYTCDCIYYVVLC